MTTPDPFKIVSKYNTEVTLTPDDKNSGVKIYCQEDYAQELYDRMNKLESTGQLHTANKDLEENGV